MIGVELAVGGRFAANVIGKVIDKAGSYLGDNYDLHSGTAQMLKNLQNSLPQIQAVIEVASKRPITNRGLETWLDNLKNAAYDAQDVLDDLEAKRIHEGFKGKSIVSSSGRIAKILIFSDVELNKLKKVVDELGKISMGVGDFIRILECENSNTRMENTDSGKRETSSNLNPNLKIFGRDSEIDFILDMVMNYQLKGLPQGNLDEQPESRDETKGEGTSSFWGYEGILRASKRFLGIIGYPKAKTVESGEKGKEPEGKSSDNVPDPLCIKNWKLPILPVFGLGGVGKTTIAKIVYNNKSVCESFALRAWVYVSEDFDVKKIMQEMILSLRLDSDIDPVMNLDTTERKLIKIIEFKRFFLVLDEVPDGFESIWDGLLSVLSNGAPGSLVMITTQSERVAKTIGNIPNIIALDVLERESFQQLFEYYAFGAFKLPDMQNLPSLHPLKEEEFSTLKLIGKRIADKLHGLPLAGVVIGTILSTRLNIEYWEEILGNDWWNDKYFLKGILPSLGVGYMYLHPDLRQCFAFCSIFPKHYVFEKDRLVQMWIAHDFIQPSKEEEVRLYKREIRLEDIGRNWFDRLVERSFFHPTVSDGKYIMHDLIRDLAIAVSSNDFSFVVSNNMQLPSCTRHMAIDCNGLKVEWKNKSNARLRTILFFGNWKNCSSQYISNIFGKSYGLRLLDLSYIGIGTNKPMYSIGQLFHLRFLDLSFSGIKSIPDELCALCHLQVLDVRGCTFKKLPKSMNKLINLRHLYASVDTISLIPGIGKLTNLQELDEFRVGIGKGHKISELMDMNEISGHLLLNDLQNVSNKEEAATAQLAKKKHLKSLELKYGYTNYQTRTRLEMDILDALKPSLSIEMLTIKGDRWVRYPGWMLPDFFNLRSIHVSCIGLTILPAFGELPSLEVLTLDNLPDINTIGSEFYGHSHVAFPCLKVLTFSHMPSWREWSDAGHGKSFLHMEKLDLSYCPALNVIPANCLSSTKLKLLDCGSFNITRVLQAMSSLTHLSIDRCCRNLSIYCTPLKNSLECMVLRRIDQLHFVGGLKCLVNLRKLLIFGFNEILESYEIEQETEEIIQECQEQCLQSLSYLHLSYESDSIQSLHRVGKLPSLRTLLISYFPGIEYTREDESWFQQLTSLEELHFYYCMGLKRLPSTLPTLSSLKKLTIAWCPTISSLLETSLPQKLTELHIIGCPNLVHRCQPQGDDWCKISHIPCIRIHKADPPYEMMRIIQAEVLAVADLHPLRSKLGHISLSN